MRRLLPVLLLIPALAGADAPITVTFLHCNDTHGHIEPTMIRKKPYGGFARQMTLLKRFRASDPNPVFLHAGDAFQGTLYFNVYGGLADLAYFDLAGVQAQTVGNHEFDKGPKLLADYARRATFPLLAANLDVSGDPDLKDWIKPSTVLEVGGEKIGVVGSITPDTPTISSPGPTVRFLDNVPSIQAAVDDLTKRGINKIVLLSHNGYKEDQEIVRRVRGLDVVIGGHSHTPLGVPELPGWPKSGGAYPTWTNDPDGRRIPVVQAWEWGKVLGRLQVRFDARGEVESLPVAEAVVLDETVPEDPAVAAMVAAFQAPIAELQNREVGESRVPLDKPSGGTESLMANVVADAYQATAARSGAVVSFVNAGGVRASLEAGPVTYGEAISVTPFGNTLVLLDLDGRTLKAALEEGIGTGGLLLPSRGFAYAYDESRPKGSRLLSATLNGAAIEDGKVYTCAFSDFTANGGDAHEALKNAPGRRLATGLLDLDLFLEYLQKNRPLDLRPEGRISKKG